MICLAYQPSLRDLKEYFSAEVFVQGTMTAIQQEMTIQNWRDVAVDAVTGSMAWYLRS